MSLSIRKLSPELQEIAKSQLNENESNILEILTQFKQWIEKSPHLKSRMDDQFLIMFLRGCKYSLERAKQKLDMFYTVRTHVPEFMGTRERFDEKAITILRLGSMLALPQAEKNGPRIIIIRPGSYDATKYDIRDILQVFMLINDLLLIEDDHLTVAGSLSILDLKDVTLNHLTQMTPSVVKKMTMMMQDASPIRQKGIHYINTPVGFEKVMNLFKSFMNEKMKKRIYVHGNDMNSLFKVIPRKLMPKDYGGDSDSISEIIEQWEQKIRANYEYLQDEITKYGVDEKKRIGKSKNPETLFGIDGTFRQLEID
ncbi:hypothetical protein PVAND_002305 [Polypedilum vanderplanki]|uniref:CRAL-TRIO domain-containing protein n=1 Tax=Polypedilum vanderplanki TaxID=319348 RepID=A0A9J6BR15_POLVA|nr:hypothetical protein PVAND_002305 [Polypedilum vanderplanki]